jgi:PAS domain S-box-containing protein
LRSRQVGAYGLREQALIERLASRVSSAIENAELYSQARQAEQELRESREAERRLAQENALLAEAGRIISSTLDIDEVYERFAQEMKKLVDFDRVMVSAVDQEAGTYTLKYYFGSAPTKYPIGFAKPLDGSMNQYVIRTGRTLRRDDTVRDCRFLSDPDNNAMGLCSSIMVPLKSKGWIIGTLSLRSRQVGAYGPREQVILERLADLIAPAIENSELFAQTKQAQEELRRSEEQYRALFEQSGEAIFLSSPVGQTVAVNQPAVELFGYSLEELIQLDENDFWVYPDELTRWFNELLEQGSVKDLEIKLRHKNGTEMDCIITSTLLRDNNGQVLASQCVVRDVTERKRWEQALQESEQRFRYLVESAADAFLVFNREGRLTDVNPASV